MKKNCPLLPCYAQWAEIDFGVEILQIRNYVVAFSFVFRKIHSFLMIDKQLINKILSEIY